MNSSNTTEPVKENASLKNENSQQMNGKSNDSDNSDNPPPVIIDVDESPTEMLDKTTKKAVTTKKNVSLKKGTAPKTVKQKLPKMIDSNSKQKPVTSTGVKKYRIFQWV